MLRAKPYLSVIIVSDSKSNALKAVTKECIDTAKESGVDTEIIVVEKQDVQYEGCIMVKQAGVFNYNRFLNEGASIARGEYIAFCNNDLIFVNGWGKKLIERMKHHNVLSASPICPIRHKGEFKFTHDSEMVSWKCGISFAGWCFVWHKNLFEKHKLPEAYEFYCADNATVKMLEQNNIKHLITAYSQVYHLGSITQKTLDSETKEQYTTECVRKWNRATGDNIFGLT